VAGAGEVPDKLDVPRIVPAIKRGIVAPVFPVSNLSWRIAGGEVRYHHASATARASVDEQDLCVADAGEVPDKLDVPRIVPAIKRGIVAPVFPVSNLSWRIAGGEVRYHHASATARASVDEQDLCVADAGEVPDKLDVPRIMPAIERRIETPVFPVSNLSWWMPEANSAIITRPSDR
jgi:hypothetical protein